MPERPHGEHQVGPCAEHLVGDPVLTQRRVCRLRLHDPPDLVDRRRIVLRWRDRAGLDLRACANHYPEAPSPPGPVSSAPTSASGSRPPGSAGPATSWPRPGAAATSARSSPGLLGIGVDPPVAIGQRALLVRTGEATCSGTRPATWTVSLQAVADAGGLRAVTASHPHWSMAEWSRAFDADVLVPGPTWPG